MAALFASEYDAASSSPATATATATATTTASEAVRDSRMDEDGVFRLNMAEVGFLTGSGVATWAEFLPSLIERLGLGRRPADADADADASRPKVQVNLWGFDLDVNNFRNNF